MKTAVSVHEHIKGMFDGDDFEVVSGRPIDSVVLDRNQFYKVVYSLSEKGLYDPRAFLHELMEWCEESGQKPFCWMVPFTPVDHPEHRLFSVSVEKDFFAYKLFFRWMRKPTSKEHFIVYQERPIEMQDGVEWKLADVDLDNLGYYFEDRTVERFLGIVDNIRGVNLKNRLLSLDTVRYLHNLVSKMGLLIKEKTGAKKVFYTGNGFRLWLPFEVQDELVKKGALCSSASVRVQPQRICSPQLRKPTLQTEIELPVSFSNFKESNPCFFWIQDTKRMYPMIQKFYSNFFENGRM